MNVTHGTSRTSGPKPELAASGADGGRGDAGARTAGMAGAEVARRLLHTEDSVIGE